MDNQELIYALETATVALERIAAALEVIAGAKPISKIIGEELAKDPEFLMGVPEVTQCVPKFHLSKCTHTVYNCAVKVEGAPTPMGFTQCTALLSEMKLRSCGGPEAYRNVQKEESPSLDKTDP